MFDHGDGYGQPAAAVTSAALGRTVNGHPAGDHDQTAQTLTTAY